MAKEPGEDAAVAVWAGISFAVIGAFGALAFVTARIGPAAIPIWFAVVGGGSWALRGPIGQAIATRLGGRAQSEPAELPQELYGELDELRARVAELEERVDFSERLLARPTEKDTL
ncbi:MAG TPA: hypothetical protein VHW65_05765 [Gemmatimonadales bacterium]|jgi:hypothetical protein|nr:hypothetical protein [Gemmatimonadales bacterium]